LRPSPKSALRPFRWSPLLARLRLFRIAYLAYWVEEAHMQVARFEEAFFEEGALAH